MAGHEAGYSSVASVGCGAPPLGRFGTVGGWKRNSEVGIFPHEKRTKWRAPQKNWMGLEKGDFHPKKYGPFLGVSMLNFWDVKLVGDFFPMVIITCNKIPISRLQLSDHYCHEPLSQTKSLKQNAAPADLLGVEHAEPQFHVQAAFFSRGLHPTLLLHQPQNCRNVTRYAKNMWLFSL